MQTNRATVTLAIKPKATTRKKPRHGAKRTKASPPPAQPPVIPTVGQLAARALLVDVDVPYWRPTVTDRALSEETNKKYDTDGSFQKRLLSREQEADLNRAATDVVRTFKKFTLPWEDGGARIIAQGTYFVFEKALREATQRYAEEADKTESMWDRHVADRKKHDKSFKAEHYPTAAEVRSRYGVRVHWRGVPMGEDLRISLSDDALAAVKASIDNDQQDRIKAALFNLAGQVKEVLTHMVEKLNNYKPRTKEAKAESTFRDSLVTNVREVAELLPALNITGDPRIDQLAVEMTKLAAVEPETLREDERVRQQTVSAADAILKKVGDFI